MICKMCGKREATETVTCPVCSDVLDAKTPTVVKGFFVLFFIAVLVGTVLAFREEPWLLWFFPFLAGTLVLCYGIGRLVELVDRRLP